jgi:LPXTG-site transpeptidase (sortase) family protein
MASTAPVGGLQSEADAVASTETTLEVNGGAGTPPSPQVSVEAQGVVAAGYGGEVVGVTSPVAVPLASVETARSVPTVGIQSEDAGTELPKATSADVSLAQDPSGGVAGDSVGSGSDEIISTSEEVLSSEAGLTAALSPMETNGGVLLGDDQEMVAYTDSELGKTGLSSAERSALNAEVAKYSLPSPSDLNGTRLTATRIRIPVIDVDSDVSELKVVLSDDQRVWETPKWVVGHIPTTPLPGEQGQGWYFGHLESLIRGEGSVFRRLPEIPELLPEGEPIYVFLETADRKYLYQVYKTDVVHQDDLLVADSGQRDITLVTCYPRLIYDQRILVTAALVGVSES